MDLNETAARQHMSEAMAAAAPAYDPAHADVIHQARADAQRQIARAIVEEPELLMMFGAVTSQDPIFTKLRALGLPEHALGARMIPGNPYEHTQDRFTLVAHRHELDRWEALFAEVAQRLGYVKRAPTAADRVRTIAARAAGVATGAAVLFGLFG